MNDTNDRCGIRQLTQDEANEVLSRPVKAVIQELDRAKQTKERHERLLALCDDAREQNKKYRR